MSFFSVPLDSATLAWHDSYMSTYTAQQVSTFAEMIRPFLTDTSPAAVAAAVIAYRDAEDAAAVRIQSNISLFVDALSGTYDEFRAEAGK